MNRAKSKKQKPRLVQETADKLRDIILEREPEAYIGSLDEVAQMLEVGIVTTQQAARVLEHEGLLSVKRGPGGGYYGTRPDESALERAFATYMRVHGFDYRDTLEMIALLDCEIIPSAARCEDEGLREELRGMHDRINQCETAEDRVAFERELHQVLFRTVRRPLLELLARVTTQLFDARPRTALFSGQKGVATWKNGRQRILLAILQQDDELARFEAERFRREILSRLARAQE